jgi:hypothetical protein
MGLLATALHLVDIQNLHLVVLGIGQENVGVAIGPGDHGRERDRRDGADLRNVDRHRGAHPMSAAVFRKAPGLPARIEQRHRGIVLIVALVVVRDGCGIIGQVIGHTGLR